MDALTNTYQRSAHRCANIGRHTPEKYVGQYGDRRKYMSCAQGGALQQETHNSPNRNHVPTNKQARGHVATPRCCLSTMYTAPWLRLGRSLIVALICCPTVIASSGPNPASLAIAMDYRAITNAPIRFHRLGHHPSLLRLDYCKLTPGTLVTVRCVGLLASYGKMSSPGVLNVQP